ncbi:aminoacyl-tRNA hydrolase [Mucisphaera calidilacus]|uniref:Peptidyl-tRNA hydrolase n=1 Tax=Mucisphaera calidilacus TaxID=2527982 RepID=A0A518BV37_9BACT|nr:aminoacyl-tRNA hydrolase [Mucisphaera calidilacus]QDU70853.1 Peptidyl-tRNA hydrolase [Mucisphaera calidilacus]
MKLIVGLGNPGPQYAKTRHNAGFMVVDRLAERHGMTGGKSRFSGLFTDGLIASARAGLLKPMTYMNLSGQAVVEAMNFYKVPPEDLLVVVDDIALDCGQIRCRPEGGAGGHNGLKDIQQRLGTQKYPRLRIGIDPPGRIPQVDYVLGRFTPDQQQAMEQAVPTACDAIETWLTHGITETMNRYN